jgi:hypothetical protein
MSVSFVSTACQPEGAPLEFAGLGLKAGPPSHCHGKYDTVRSGLLGGYRCSCECNREQGGGE